MQGHLGEIATVLVVDDETGVRDLMRRWLVASGYTVTTAASAEEGLERMQVARAAVALCDIRMPDHDGFWLVERLRRDFPDTAVIMATGVHDVASAVTSLRKGVIDYLTKPFGRDRLREAVQRGVEWHRAARTSREWREALHAEADTRQAQLGQSLAALNIDSPQGVDALLTVLTIHDRGAYAHAYRVAGLATNIARRLDLDEVDVSVVERAGLLHDLGKLAIPDSIVRKPGSLAMEEQEIIRTHPERAHTLLASVPYFADIAEVVRCIREWYDGGGYPRRLRGNEIPIGSRIIAVADVYDIITRPRSFRDALSTIAAIEELVRSAGTQLDPRAVDALRQMLTEN